MKLLMQYPTDYAVEVLTPIEVANILVQNRQGGRIPVQPPAGISESRRMYARIRTRTRSTTITHPTEPVPFHIRVEKLHFGVLPTSVIWMLTFLIPIAVLAGLMVPHVNAYFERLTDAAQRDLARLAEQQYKKDR